MCGCAKLRIRWFMLKLLQRLYPSLLSDIPVRAIVLSKVVLGLGVRVERMAEVGVWRGHSSAGFLRLLSTVKECFLIDSWAAYDGYISSGDSKVNSNLSVDKKICEDRVSFFGDKVEVCHGFSEDVADRIPDKSLDFVFIDANHSYEYVKRDILIWKRKVRLGGVLAGHDIDAPAFPGVRRAVEESIAGKINTGDDAVWWTVVA